MFRMSLMMPYEEHGSSKSNRVIVFIAGFPDDETSGWGSTLDDIVTSYSGDVRLICMCMPGLQKNQGTTAKSWGYKVPEILDMINETINTLVPDPNAKVNLVIHDWGAYFGLLYENKFTSKVNKMVIVDVGMLRNKNMKYYQFLVIALYQWWFAIAYIISQVISWSLGNFIYKLYKWLCPHFLSPLKMWEYDLIKRDLSVSYCALYYNFWKAFFLRGNKEFIHQKFPTVKTLFMYGADKNIYFHDQPFFDKLNLTEGSRAIAVEGSGHWIMLSNPSLFVKEIKDFL